MNSLGMLFQQTGNYWFSVNDWNGKGDCIESTVPTLAFCLWLRSMCGRLKISIGCVRHTMRYAGPISMVAPVWLVATETEWHQSVGPHGLGRLYFLAKISTAL